MTCSKSLVVIGFVTRRVSGGSPLADGWASKDLCGSPRRRHYDWRCLACFPIVAGCFHVRDEVQGDRACPQKLHATNQRTYVSMSWRDADQASVSKSAMQWGWLEDGCWVFKLLVPTNLTEEFVVTAPEQPALALLNPFWFTTARADDARTLFISSPIQAFIIYRCPCHHARETRLLLLHRVLVDADVDGRAAHGDDAV
jgi:hypothetical protein